MKVSRPFKTAGLVLVVAFGLVKDENEDDDENDFKGDHREWND